MDSSALRMLDANANRAREGLRTAEDFIRFSFGDAIWARRLRNLRHEITSAFTKSYSDVALRARRVSSDCGSAANEPESHKSSGSQTAHEVAVRGLKRAQEAVRVLEEYSRGPQLNAAQAFSEIRFKLYEAEAWLQAGFPFTQK